MKTEEELVQELDVAIKLANQIIAELTSMHVMVRCHVEDHMDLNKPEVITAQCMKRLLPVNGGPRRDRGLNSLEIAALESNVCIRQGCGRPARPTSNYCDKGVTHA